MFGFVSRNTAVKPSEMTKRLFIEESGSGHWGRLELGGPDKRDYFRADLLTQKWAGKKSIFASHKWASYYNVNSIISRIDLVTFTKLSIFCVVFINNFLFCFKKSPDPCGL